MRARWDYLAVTLVIACLTAEYVVLAADRRLSRNTGELVDDDASKMVLLGNQVAFAYTGLANLRPEPRGRTDLWLVDQLALPPDRLPEVFARLAANATQTFGRITHAGPQAKRHAFVGAGWEGNGVGRLKPFVGIISNAEEPDGSWGKWPRPEFRLGRAFLEPGSPFGVYSTGQPATAELAELEVTLGACGLTKPARVASHVGGTIRQVAARNPAVGGGLSVAILPKSAVGRVAGYGLQGYRPTDQERAIRFPDAEGPAVYYVPPDSTAGTIRGAHYVSREMAIADIQIHDRALTPEEIRLRYEEGLRQRRS